MSGPAKPSDDRDRDSSQRPRNARPRDALGRPLGYGAAGVERQPEGHVRTSDATLAEGKRLFDAGMPFHAHEVFEDAWKASDTPDRELWRGLAQVAVGVTHAARGNRRGALALLRRGADTLLPFAGASPSVVDVSAVLQWVDESVRQVELECPTTLTTPPLT